MKKIRIFDLKFEKKLIKYFQKETIQIFKDGFFTAHRFSRLFEKEFSRKYGYSNSISTSSGTSALEILMRSLNLKKKIILINSNTFIATAHAASNAGYKLDFVDLENKFFGMCPKDLLKKIKFYKKRIGAVIIVHIGGFITPNIYKIIKICKKYNIPLIEDAAQAQGSKLNGKYAGNFGLAAAFSFFTTKVMTTGEGGMIVSKSKNIIKKCLSNRQFGCVLNNKLKHKSISSNYKFNEFGSLLGLAELKRVDERIKKRNLIANRYFKNLKDNKNFNLLMPRKNSLCNFYKFIIVPKSSRKIISDTLKKRNISITGGVYYIPLHLQPIYKNVSKYKYPITEYFCKKHVCLPCYPEMKLKDVDIVCKVLNSNFK